VHVTKAYERVEVKLHSFLILALDEITDQLHIPAAFPPDKIAFIIY
jgi:hypothetical protein